MSRNKKKVTKYFSVVEYEKEQEYLRKQHNQGWKLTEVKDFCKYTFTKCEPEDVIYQLDYNQDRKKDMDEYIQMFQDCGWEYICDYVDYSYFRKPVTAMQEEEAIFNDDGKLDMLERVLKGKIIPLLVLFLLVFCPLLVKCFLSTEAFGKVIFGLLCWISVSYVVIWVKWILMYCKLKRK